MVKGLLIRQVLTGINLLFAVLVAYIIYLIGMQQFGAPYKQREITIDSNANNESGVPFVKVGPRTDYDLVASGAMFGDAGKTATPNTEQVETKPTVITTAPLKLYATVASFPTDPLATAIIENPMATTPSKIGTYYQGQTVMDNLKLVEVHRRRVILYNEAKKQKEELLMAQLGDAAPAKPALERGPRGAKAAAAGAGTHVSVQRQEVIDELNSVDQAELLNQLNPQLVKDEQGNVTGITSASLSSVAIAQKVGLQDNDVIQSVNGVQIDSVEKVGEIAQKFQNANTFRMSIMRDGKPQMITSKVE